MAVFLKLFVSFLGSETVKTLVKMGTRKLVKEKGTSIDPELAKALLSDISESNGNNFAIDLTKTVITEMKDKEGASR